MHKLLATSAAARPTGSPPQRKLFRVPDGVFKGRLLALYMNSVSGISLAYSDNPYSTWSAPQQIIGNSFDSPFSASMDDSGNIRIVYTDSLKDIKYLKLSFAAGAWTAGSPVTVVNTDDSYNPFIMADGDGKLWCMFVNHQTSSDMNYYVRSKTSSDDGQTWGSGSLDLGAQLSAGSPDNCFVAARQLSSKIFAVFADGRSSLKYRVYDFDLGAWGSETAIHAGNFIDNNFDIDISPDKKLGVAFAVSSDAKIYFKEFDGSGWSGLQQIENAECKSPQIVYAESIPDIFYAKIIAGDYRVLRSARKSGDSFTVSDYSPSIGLFDSVFVYDNSAIAKFEDVTAAAADSSAGDVFHSVSSALLNSIEDCLYLGKGHRFFCCATILSIAGVGGQVVWEYFDGAVWKSFVPADGAYHFDSTDKLVYLWVDGESAPPDWQVGSVNGYPAYWVRARVIAAYTVNPVGSQIFPAPRCVDLVLARHGN